jgi:pyruvate dehydrogenase E2 component (dihydrolipoamide acetyltransferase)
MDVLMPQLGETVAEGKITKWFKSAGDAVKPGDDSSVCRNSPTY